MADHHAIHDGIFVYMGGEQVVPMGVRRVRIDPSVKIIPRRAFSQRENLIYVEFHDGVEIIEKWAFLVCPLLKSVKLLGVRVIEKMAFSNFFGLTDVEFGGKLEAIEQWAFAKCTSLRNVRMPSVRTIGEGAFTNCKQLTDIALPEALEAVEGGAFGDCPSLRRIAMPLKDDMIDYDVFNNCRKLTTVYLVGGIHKTISSLHLESWKSELRREINQINQVLFSRPHGKTAEIKQWSRSVIRRFDHYKTEHHALLKEATTLLELALWKAKIDEKERECLGEMKAKKAKIDVYISIRWH